jgi:hypothetical protein
VKEFREQCKKQTTNAMEEVHKTEEEGGRGLGIINLRKQNMTLLLKFLHKFYNKREIPWIKLIWNTHYGNREILHATKGRGSS